MNKNNTFWVGTTVIALVVGVGGYAVLAERGIVPSFTSSLTTSEEATTTPPTSTPPVTTPAEPPPVMKVTVEPPKPTPPVADVLDIRDLYATIVAPPIRSDEPRSGTKEITVRGTLNVIKVEVLCQTQPCPQPDSSNYRFELLDMYEPSKYELNVRKTGDPVIKDLTDGQLYTIRGTLHYSFSDTGKPTFTFDPVQVMRVGP